MNERQVLVKYKGMKNLEYRQGHALDLAARRIGLDDYDVDVFPGDNFEVSIYDDFNRRQVGMLSQKLFQALNRGDHPLQGSVRVRGAPGAWRLAGQFMP